MVDFYKEYEVSEKKVDRYHFKKAEFNQYAHKFDYFMLGLSTAVLAFTVQSFEVASREPMKWLLFISWGFLLFTILFGIARIQHRLRICKIEVDKEVAVMNHDAESIKRIIIEINLRAKLAYWYLIVYLISFFLSLLLLMPYKIIETL